MTVSVFFNILISSMISVLSFMAARLSFVKFAPKTPFRLFGFFWFFTGIVWLVVVARLLSAYLGYMDLDKALFVAGQFFVAVSIVMAGAYVSWRVFLKDKIIPIAVVVFSVGAGIFVVFMLHEGVVGPVVDSWGTKYIPGETTSVILFILIAAVMIGATYSLLASVSRFVLGNKVNWSLTLSMLSFVLYGIGGALDEFGVGESWKLILVRTMLVVAAMTAYAALLNLNKKTYAILKENDRQK